MPTGGYQRVGGPYYLHPLSRIPLRDATSHKSRIRTVTAVKSVQFKKPELSVWWVMKTGVFWKAMLYSVADRYQHYGEASWLQFQRLWRWCRMFLRTDAYHTTSGLIPTDRNFIEAVLCATPEAQFTDPCDLSIPSNGSREIDSRHALALYFGNYTSHEMMTLMSYPEYSVANYFLSRKNY